MSKVFEPLQPKILLAIGAHADDIDAGAGGSIAKWAQAGTVIYYVVITNGCKGSTNPSISDQDLATIRKQEQSAAAANIGVKEVRFLGYEDGMLEITMELKKQLVQIIRELKPDTIITLDPTNVYVADTGFINHPDHRATGQATLDAVYPLARDCHSLPEAGPEPHKVSHVLLINLERHNYTVDVTATIEIKNKALRQHASQFSNTKIAALTAMASQLGGLSGAQYAEGFMRIDIPA